MDFSKLEADTIKLERLSSHDVEIEIQGIAFNQQLNGSSAFILNFIQQFPFYDNLFNNSHLLRTLEKKIRGNLVDKKSLENKSDKISVEKAMKNWQFKPTDRIRWKTEFGEIKNTQVSQIEAILYSIGLSKFYSLLNSINSKLTFLIIPSPQETLKLQIYPTNLIPIKINSRQTFTIINLFTKLANFQEKSFIPLNFPNVIHWTPAGHHVASKLVYNSMIDANILPNIKNAKKNFLSVGGNHSFKIIEESNGRISAQLKEIGHDSFTRGAIYLSQNKFDRAEESFKRFITINPKDNEALWILANLYFKNNKYKTSLDFIEKATLNDYPISDAVYALKAMNYFKLNRFDKAELLFSKAISLSPMNALLHYNFGNFFLLRNRFEEAIFELEQANHLFPNDIKTILTMGTAYFVSGEKTDAIKFFERALKIDSQNPMIQKTLQSLNIEIRRKNIQ
jgi:Tfp pilus assembly protein PilF